MSGRGSETDLIGTVGFIVEVFRQPVIDRLTLRLLNRRQLSPQDFEGGESGLRLNPEALKSYLALYEEQLRAESEGKGTPTWRGRLQEQVDALKEMVMTGHPAPLYTWKDRASAPGGEDL